MRELKGFSVNLAVRHDNRLLTDQIVLLRMPFADVKAKPPYEIDAVDILPEHIHCIPTLPENDSDFSKRWGLIKAYFSCHIAKGERISTSRNKRGLYPENWYEDIDLSKASAGE